MPSPAQPIEDVYIQGNYVDWTELLRGLIKRSYRLADIGAFNVQYVGPDCATASQQYYTRQQALYETAQEMEEDAIEMDNAACAVQQFVCERPGDIPSIVGKTLCLDGFIMAPTMLLIGEGG